MSTMLSLVAMMATRARQFVSSLTTIISSFATKSQDREQHLAVRCRLLALVPNEASTTIIVDEQGFMGIVLALLSFHSHREEGNKS
jgi:hypothetical protein